MKQTITKLLGGALFALFLVPSNAQADWKDIKVDLTNGNLALEGEKTQGTWINSGDYIGFAVDGGGAVSRVAKDDASAVCQIKGKWHSNQWGWTNTEIIVPVEGTVKITYGAAYSYGGTVTVKNSSNETVATLSTLVDGVYYDSTHPEKVVYTYYSGPATTLTLTGGNYLLYLAIEASDYVPDNKTVTFSTGTTGATGVVPDAQTKDINLDNKLTIPTNHSLYLSGNTLTGWTDGANTYSVGDTYTITDDVTLTPVFTPNTTTLADRAAATVITWDFRRANGAPIVEWQGSGHADHIWVGQATIGGKTIDVKMDLDASSGKFNNASNTDCTQTNSGTTFTIPSLQDAVIELESHSSFTISSTTIDGSTAYTGTGTSHVSYTVTSTSGSSTIVIEDGSYYKYVKITLPAQPTRTVTISSAKYATYYSNIAYTLPENLQAATIDGETSGTLTLNYRYSAGDKVPGGTPVLLKATAAGDYTLTMDAEDATAAPTGNYLYGSDVATTTTGGDKYYALMYGTDSNASVLGFYWVNAGGAAFTSPAHKAWLALPDGGANFFSLDDNTTGINMVNGSEFKVNGEYYNLAGQHVAQPTKGLYILQPKGRSVARNVNGKKVLVK